MSDDVLSRFHGRSVSPEHLEVLGKRASARWAKGDFKTLTEAVTDTVKQASLNTEQVKRVVEHANTDAYLGEWNKEGSVHRVVEFPGGPADAGAILQNLNLGGSPTKYDRGLSDYHSPPSVKVASVGAASMLKTAAAEDQLLASAFGESHLVGEALPYASSYGDELELRDKLAGAADHLTSELSGLELMYADLADRVFQGVKQASLRGTALSSVLRAWESVAPSADHIKVAFQLLTPRLLREGVFPTLEEMTASVDKLASAGMVNPKHPLVTDFADFCDVLSKMAEVRQARNELRGNANQLTEHMRKAAGFFGGAAEKPPPIRAGGAAGGAYHAVNNFFEDAGRAADPVLRRALGHTAGGLASTAIRWTPQAAIAGGLLEANAYKNNSPGLPASAMRFVERKIKEQVPGSDDNLMRAQRYQYGG